MTAVLAPAGADPVGIVAGLREWAAGFSADEAAVELLAAIAVEVPAVLDLASPWLERCPRPGVWCLDGAALAEVVDSFPASMRPVILVAAALAVDGALVEVGVVLAGVPCEWLGPVFAALAHAAGCPGLQLVATNGTEPGLFSWLEASAIPRPRLPLDRRPEAVTSLDGAA